MPSLHASAMANHKDQEYSKEGNYRVIDNAERVLNEEKIEEEEEGSAAVNSTAVKRRESQFSPLQKPVSVQEFRPFEGIPYFPII